MGTVRRLIYAKDVLADPSLLASRSSVANPVATPPLPPRFAGFDDQENPIAYSGPKADPKSSASNSSSGASNSNSNSFNSKAALQGYAGLDPETVVGVAWTDEANNERITLSRLTVVADGYYSAHRDSMHTNSKPQVCEQALHR